MMKLVIYLNYLRAIPAILAYLFVSDKEVVNKDIERNLGDKNKGNHDRVIFKLVRLLVYKKPFRNIFYYRIKQKNKVIGGVLNFFFHQKPDLEISGDIGPGLAIWHGYGTVISCNKIGENFSVWQGVTIGRNPKPLLDNDKPNIGDNCAVYSNAVVAGGIEIGNNVKIGAGCICMKNVPDNSVVIGNPCIIKSNTVKENV